MHTPTLHSVLILMNVSRINSKTVPVRRSYIAPCQPDFLFSIRIFIIAFHNHAPLHFESYCSQNLQADDGARTPNRNRTAKPLFSIIQSNTSYLWNIHTIKLTNASTIYSLRHWIKSQHRTTIQTTLQHASTPL